MLHNNIIAAVQTDSQPAICNWLVPNYAFTIEGFYRQQVW